MPTCLETDNTTYPDTDSLYALQGKSLLKIFKGDTFDRGALFWEHETNRGVRVGKWKLASEGNDQPPWAGEWELYNLEKDRIESNNLADQYPDKVNPKNSPQNDRSQHKTLLINLLDYCNPFFY